MLSIIIPTLNEESYLPLLLKSLEKQNFKDFEIIVADAGSKDRTAEIAKKYGCRLVKGGLPAKGRNEGAKVARGDLLLFLDADVVLSGYSLKKFLNEFKRKKLDIAVSFLYPRTKHKVFQIIFLFLYNFPILILERVNPHGSNFILIKKSLHEKIKGFDESLKLFEDHDYIQRGAKIGKFGVLKSAKVFTSLRRFYKEGWMKTSLKYLLCELHQIFFGPVKSEIFKIGPIKIKLFQYKFGHYNHLPRKEEEKLPPIFKISGQIFDKKITTNKLAKQIKLFLKKLTEDEKRS